MLGTSQGIRSALTNPKMHPEFPTQPLPPRPYHEN
jgi:hypothetical protein